MKNKKLTKKGYSMDFLITGTIGLLILILVVVIAAGVNQNLLDQQTGNSTSYNVSEAGQLSLEQFGDNFSIIVTIVIAVFILGLVVLLRNVMGGGGGL